MRRAGLSTLGVEATQKTRCCVLRAFKKNDRDTLREAIRENSTSLQMWSFDGEMKESSLSPWQREESHFGLVTGIHNPLVCRSLPNQQILAPNRYSIFKGSKSEIQPVSLAPRFLLITFTLVFFELPVKAVGRHE